MTLRDRWHERAGEWMRWASTAEHDHYFWRMNMPSLLALLPAPGRLTLDIGCGEGRMARELIARGHQVVGVEASPTLAEAARAGEPAVDVVVADASAIPLADGAADLAVASMSLMNMDDLGAVGLEIARILAPGGRLCFSIVHPFNSREQAGGGAYFAERDYAITIARDGLTMEFHDRHRPLGAYFAALEDAGFAVEALREPVPDEKHVRDRPEAEVWRDKPIFLQIRALKAS